MPRFIIFIRANSYSESELKPNPELIQAMSNYNDTLRETGVLDYGDGLTPALATASGSSSTTLDRLLFNPALFLQTSLSVDCGL